MPIAGNIFGIDIKKYGDWKQYRNNDFEFVKISFVFSIIFGKFFPFSYLFHTIFKN